MVIRQAQNPSQTHKNNGWITSSRHLLAERSFPQIDIFEQRSTVGGVWNFSPEASLHVALPQISPYVPVEEPQQYQDGELIFPSPMYEGLHANIPHELMGFTDLPLAGELFPPHKTVKEYVEEYANDVRHLIHFSTQVLDVQPLDLYNPDEGNCGEIWRLKTRKSGTQLEEVRDYDAVIMAAGHYNVPYVPDIPGLAAWDEHYPGVVTHSQSYRRPDSFKGKVSRTHCFKHNSFMCSAGDRAKRTARVETHCCR
jgi:cation diffusion facilitator CzcD-associated flavoprotein CzcO